MLINLTLIMGATGSVSISAVAMPHCDADAENALHRTAIEAPQD